MKLRVLISFLFIIATLVVSIHEIQHITGEHESASCQICIVEDHLVSAYLNSDASPTIVSTFEKIDSTQTVSFKHFKKVTNHSTAPPKIS